MKLMDAVRYGFSNYANFKGRTDRPTFWWWVLALFILFFVLNLVDAALMGSFQPGPDGKPTPGQPVSAIAGLATLLPSLAMAVRRLHDVGKSGWWLLLGFVPFVGQLVLLYFYVQPSSPNALPSA
ncbi:MAG: DUF805 domain-containing protein [Ottowia sp.]|uniref:DUF805 domain-containing protein n=1 Tax=Ottowia sp. TaxID=1898956 RepID=UPI001DC58755|nr:DUF805 domain-containing protein [Ottowia sp.]MCP5258375.1 DUF805 domain-containing protein [Burkholderiaceae bacterium]MCB2024008.1 DUF805 domain-containing protein [Ottowia sp.]MCB2071071.1 DUF805 domain-containing protein [Ottowia sp.]HPK32660.1 DUF805 domain-containing protein [Ottowia sp.]HPR45899.1 DUF805 domain-containing protein [Ottowia sp.]